MLLTESSVILRSKYVWSTPGPDLRGSRPVPDRDVEVDRRWDVEDAVLGKKEINFYVKQNGLAFYGMKTALEKNHIVILEKFATSILASIHLGGSEN